MASTNKTANFNLNQWVKTDPVLMADFNADNLAVDTAMKQLSDGVSAAGNCRITTGSYVGTGTYGSDSPNTLCFDFAPTLVIITVDTNPENGNSGSFYSCTSGNVKYLDVGAIKRIKGRQNPPGSLYCYCSPLCDQSTTNYDIRISVSTDGKTITWYSPSDYGSASKQSNYNNWVYHYTAIG